MPCNHSFPFIIRGKVEIAFVRAYIPRISRSSVPHFRHPSWSWWTISLNSTIRRPSTIQSSLSSGSVELLKGIKLLKLAAARRLLGKLPILTYLISFMAKVKSEVRQNHHGGKNKRLFSASCTRFKFASRLRPAKHARGIACNRVLAELFLVCSALWHRC